MILNRYAHVILSLADDGSEVLLKKGEAVKVIRASEKRGYLVVEHRSSTIHLPFQVMELKVRFLCILLLLRNVSRSLTSCRRRNFVSPSRGFTSVRSSVRVRLSSDSIWETDEPVSSLGYLN